MTEELKQIFKEELIKLPREAQEAINNFAWGKITEEIGKKHSLSESEINKLQAEVAIILVGVESQDLFQENIENNLRLSKENSEKIREEVFQKIFESVRDIAEEKVKNNLKGKEMSWKQSVDFIISGGKYSSLITYSETSSVPHHPQNTDNLIGKKSMQDIKDRLIN